MKKKKKKTSRIIVQITLNLAKELLRGYKNKVEETFKKKRERKERKHRYKNVE